MATKKFLTSVADVYAYDSSDNIVFTAKTLLDSSIEVSLGSAPVRGGRGNQLQYIYYHTGEMKFTLTDTQWNLGMLGSTIGQDPASGGTYYKEETVAMSGSYANITGSALVFETGTTIYGWATNPSGTTQRITFNANHQTFTVSGSVAGNWCIRYYASNATSGQGITIKANMIPKVVKLVMETQLNSADSTTNKIGVVQIIAPTVTLSGAFTISMKADGVANTPLTGTALAFTPAAGTDACSTDPYYAKIIEIIDATYWYSDVVALAIQGGDFATTTSACTTINVWAIPSSGASFLAANSALTFAISGSDAEGATIGANTGYFYSGSAGSTEISVYITSASSVEASCYVTVT